MEIITKMYLQMLYILLLIHFKITKRNSMNNYLKVSINKLEQCETLSFVDNIGTSYYFSCRISFSGCLRNVKYIVAMAHLANEFVTFARELAEININATALDMYLCAFASDPQCKKRLVNEFLAVLAKINRDLAAAENETAIFINLEAAIAIFPDNVGLLSDTGNYLCRHGHITEALRHFERALNVDSNCISVEKQLNNVKTWLFPCDIFRTLNDKKRNCAYKAAIKSCVTAADTVIDIDVGTGLLTLYASECGAAWTDGCEPCGTWAQLAGCVMRDNQAKNVIVANISSTVLACKDMSANISVLVTDSIDSGLFGENILQSLYHAWENYLHMDSKVIPGKAEYFVVGIKCDELCNAYQLHREVKSALKIEHMNVHPSTLRAESYCSEDVNSYRNIKYMCQPKSVFTIDFNNFQDIHEKLHGLEGYTAELIANEDGEINAVIGWFNLYLTDNIVLTSDPRSLNSASAYQQAVFFDFIPRKVRQNECITVPFLTYGGRLTMPQGATIARVSLETITYLNDMEYISMLTKSIGLVCVHLAQTVLMEQVDIVDLSPFPWFGVQMMKRGANSLICIAKSMDDEVFLKEVLVANGITSSKVTILVADHWSLEVFQDKTFHVIFNHILDRTGDVNVRTYRIAEHLKHTHLTPGGICLPSSITLMGQLISSKYLDTNNRVLDENVGYHIAKHVNRYKVSQTTSLDIGTLKYEALSHMFEAASMEKLMSDVLKVPILKDGHCNAILCWYKVQLIENCKEIYTNRSNSFVRSTAYMTSSDSNKVFRGDEVNILRCVDLKDGSFKLLLENDSY